MRILAVRVSQPRLPPGVALAGHLIVCFVFVSAVHRVLCGGDFVPTFVLAPIFAALLLLFSCFAGLLLERYCIKKGSALCD